MEEAGTFQKRHATFVRNRRSGSGRVPCGIETLAHDALVESLCVTANRPNKEPAQIPGELGIVVLLPRKDEKLGTYYHGYKKFFFSTRSCNGQRLHILKNALLSKFELLK